MGDRKKKAPADVMTPERLRAYWFGSQQVPFWNYDPAQLTIGLEIEYFIAKVHGSSFQLATKQQYMAVMAHLAADSGYTDRNLEDQPGRMSKDTDRGFIAIKPDFAWHILEIALPPRRDIEDIRNLLLSTFAEVDAALAKEGLERLDMSCLPDVPESMELVELDRLSGFADPMLSRTARISELRVFPALITATHVHVNCSDELSLAQMPGLYNAELEAQKLFTRAKVFRGIQYENVRTTFYEQVFGDGYRLRATPKIIPTSLAEYVTQMNESSKIFPHDKFFPSRDMSYIRPTRHGTLEFRSACSFKDINILIDIALFRREQVLRIYSVLSALNKAIRA